MWFQQYPVQAEASGGEGAGGGTAVAEAPGATEGSGATSEAMVSPLHWAAALPEDLQALPIVRDAKSQADFVRNAEQTKRFVGESIRVPKAYDPVRGPAEGVDLTPMFTKLGRPEKPSDYQVDRGEIPEGITLQLNADEEREFLEEAHATMLAPWQVNRLAKWHTRNEIKKAHRQAAEAAVARETGRAKLYEMHGANMPSVEADARHVINLMANGVWGTPQLSAAVMAKLDKADFFLDPEVTTGLAALGSQMREGRFHGTNTPVTGAETPADVDSKLAVLNAKLHKEGLTPNEEAEVDRLYDLKTLYQTA